MKRADCVWIRQLFPKLLPVLPEGPPMPLIVVGTVPNSEEADMDATQALRRDWNSPFSSSLCSSAVHLHFPLTPHRLNSRKPYLATPFPVWARASARALDAFIISTAIWGGVCVHACARECVCVLGWALSGTQCSGTLFCRQLLKAFPP